MVHAKSGVVCQPTITGTPPPPAPLPAPTCQPLTALTMLKLDPLWQGPGWGVLTVIKRHMPMLCSHTQLFLVHVTMGCAGTFWGLSVGGNLAYQWSRPIPTSLKIIHSRVYAQVSHIPDRGHAGGCKLEGGDQQVT